MPIQIRLPTLLRGHTDGRSTVDAQGANLGELLTDLFSQYSGLRDQVLTSDGSLHRFLNVYVNDDDVRFLDQLNTRVNEGDSITILPAVAGG